MLEQKLGLCQKFIWERKDLALNWRPDLFPSRIRDSHNSTSFLYYMRYSTHPPGFFSQKEGTYSKKASTMTITSTISTIFRTWFLTLTCSPTIRPALVIHSLDSQTLSSTTKAIHVRESSTKTFPMTRHWGTITWGAHTPLPHPNPMGLDYLLGILGLGISVTIKGASALVLAVLI